MAAVDRRWMRRGSMGAHTQHIRLFSLEGSEWHEIAMVMAWGPVELWGEAVHYGGFEWKAGNENIRIERWVYEVPGRVNVLCFH
jgi:hypothetical protein